MRPTGTATVTRTSTGNYDARLDGLIRSGGLKETFQITAVGTTACAARAQDGDSTRPA